MANQHFEENNLKGINNNNVLHMPDVLRSFKNSNNIGNDMDKHSRTRTGSNHSHSFMTNGTDIKTYRSQSSNLNSNPNGIGYSLSHHTRNMSVMSQSSMTQNSLNNNIGPPTYTNIIFEDIQDKQKQKIPIKLSLSSFPSTMQNIKMGQINEDNENNYEHKYQKQEEYLHSDTEGDITSTNTNNNNTNNNNTNINDMYSKLAPQSVKFDYKEWLQQIQLQQYIGIFKEDGFDKLDAILEIENEDLIDMNIKKGHRKMLLKKIKCLKDLCKSINVNNNSNNNNSDTKSMRTNGNKVSENKSMVSVNETDSMMEEIFNDNTSHYPSETMKSKYSKPISPRVKKQLNNLHISVNNSDIKNDQSNHDAFEHIQNRNEYLDKNIVTDHDRFNKYIRIVDVPPNQIIPAQQLVQQAPIIPQMGQAMIPQQLLPQHMIQQNILVNNSQFKPYTNNNNSNNDFTEHSESIKPHSGMNNGSISLMINKANNNNNPRSMLSEQLRKHQRNNNLVLKNVPQTSLINKHESSESDSLPDIPTFKKSNDNDNSNINNSESPRSNNSDEMDNDTESSHNNSTYNNNNNNNVFNFKITVDKAKGLHKNGRIIEAAEEYSKALTYDRHNVDVRIRLALCLLESHNYEGSAKQLQSLIDINAHNKKNPMLRFVYGLLEHKRQNYNEAIRHYYKALRYDYIYQDRIYNNLASLYRSCKKYEKAKKYQLKAIERNPDNHIALLNYAKILSDMNNINDAMDAFEKAIQLRPTIPDLYVEYGEFLLDIKKDYIHATQVLKNALRLTSDNDDIRILYKKALNLSKNPDYNSNSANSVKTSNKSSRKSSNFSASSNNGNINLENIPENKRKHQYRNRKHAVIGNNNNNNNNNIFDEDISNQHRRRQSSLSLTLPPPSMQQHINKLNNIPAINIKKKNVLPPPKKGRNRYKKFGNITTSQL